MSAQQECLQQFDEGVEVLGDLPEPYLTLVDEPHELSLDESLMEEHGLTEKEFYALSEIASGKSTNEIALDKGVTSNSIVKALGRGYKKIGVSGRQEAEVWARQHALGEVPLEYTQHGLSSREAHILGRLAAGLSVRQLAIDEEMKVSGVRSSLLRTSKKIGVRGQADAIEWYREKILKETSVKDDPGLLPQPLRELSYREVDSLGLLTLGLTNQQIAERFDVTVDAVDYYLKNLYKKLEITGEGSGNKRVAAIRIARNTKLLEIAKQNDSQIIDLETMLPGTRAVIAELAEQRKTISLNIPVRNLSPAEQKLLNSLARNWDVDEAAKSVGIQVSTVRFHLTSIYSKLGVKDRIEATAQIQLTDKGKAIATKETRFSHREFEILSLITLGLSNAEIAGQLFLEESTIKFHIKSVFTKLGTKNRTQVGDVSREAGILGLIINADDGKGIPALLKAKEAIEARGLDGEKAKSDISSLTTREREILRAVATGATNLDVSKQHNISEHTVKSCLSDVYAKLGANNRTEATNLLYLASIDGVEEIKADRRGYEDDKNLMVVASGEEYDYKRAILQRKIGQIANLFEREGLFDAYEPQKFRPIKITHEPTMQILHQEGYITDEMLRQQRVDRAGLFAAMLVRIPATRYLMLNESTKDMAAETVLSEAEAYDNLTYYSNYPEQPAL